MEIKQIIELQENQLKKFFHEIIDWITFFDHKNQSKENRFEDFEWKVV